MPRLAAPAREEATSPYTAGATEQPIYTSAPRVEPLESASPPSFHIGDDAAPAAETAQRSNWSSAAWALPADPEPKQSHPLPPIE
jgi:hypothetical protein